MDLARRRLTFAPDDPVWVDLGSVQELSEVHIADKTHMSDVNSRL
jgi:hypothetical protein